MQNCASKLLPGLILAGFYGTLGLTTFAADSLLSVESTRQPTEWIVTWKQQRLLVYAFDPLRFKPYVKELAPPGGMNLLRDAPHDHLHHRALMYGIKVNGINFWEESSGCGVQKVVDSSPPEIRKSAAGLPQARLVQVLYWLAPEGAFLPNSNAPALLIERRTLTLTLDAKQQETALHWKSEFEVGPGTNVVTLTGANYHGLGMRFLQALDPLAVHLAPSGKLDLARGRQEVSAHQWVALTFDSPGQPSTLALFGAVNNARGDTRYFAMKTPFAYLSATQGLNQEPLVYRRGERFELNYLVTLYPELKSTESLAERGRQWAASSRQP